MVSAARGRSADRRRAKHGPGLLRAPMFCGASGALMTEARDGDDERARLEEAIRQPIRPQVIRPHGFAVPDDP